MIVTLLRVTAAKNRTRLTSFSDHLFLTRLVAGHQGYMGRPHMKQTIANPAQRWDKIVNALRREVAVLAETEKAWISARLAAIAWLQEELHDCVRTSGSEALCAGCPEHCCGQGKNHPGLANLLFYLLAGEELPADFTAPCPQLGPTGCHFPPARRPFNCITFNCERVEERLTAEERQRLVTLETALRALYESFASRYAGAGPQGLLIRAETLGNRPFLHRCDKIPAKES